MSKRPDSSSVVVANDSIFLPFDTKAHIFNPSPSMAFIVRGGSEHVAVQREIESLECQFCG
jgi:hypothetical protein